MSEPLLAVEKIETRYGLSQVLFGMSFAIAPGEMVTLMGRNGMGKTTTVRSIMGLTPAMAGSIRFDGQEIAACRPFVWRNSASGLFRGPADFPEPHHAREPGRDGRQPDGAADPWTLDKVCALFPRLGERLEQHGQSVVRRRAADACDRPRADDQSSPADSRRSTEGLAPLIRAEIWSCLTRLKARGQSILVIDKNVEALTRIADRHYLIERGRVVWSGTSAELAAAPQVQHQYLGI